MSADPLLDRDGFVKSYRRVADRLTEHFQQWKILHAAWTFHLLVAAADHRSGFVPGSLNAIGSEFRMGKRAFREHVRALAEAGLIEIVAAANQWSDGAGIRVVNYAEIVAGAETAPALLVPNQHRHGAKQHRHIAPDQRKRGPKKLKKLRSGAESHRSPEPDGAHTRPPSPFHPNGNRREKAMLTAVAQALGHDPHQITGSYRGSWTRVVRDVLGQGAVPAEIPFRVEAFEEIHGRSCRTATDLNKWWSTLRSPKADRARSLRQQLVEQGYDDGDVDRIAIAAVRREMGEQMHAEEGVN